MRSDDLHFCHVRLVWSYAFALPTRGWSPSYRTVMARLAPQPDHLAKEGQVSGLPLLRKIYLFALMVINTSLPPPGGKRIIGSVEPVLVES